MSPKRYAATKIAAATTSTKVVAAAASVAIVGAFGIGAATLARADAAFDPREYLSAYGQGESNAETGYRANPTETDAEANRNDDESDNDDKSADTDRTAQDAFSDVPLDGASGTTAVNVTGTGEGAVAGAGANGEGTADGAIAGPVVPGGEGEGGTAGDTPSGPDAPGGDDPAAPPSPGGDDPVNPPAPDPIPTPSEPAQPENPSDGGYDVLPEDPEPEKPDMGPTEFDAETVTGGNTSLAGANLGNATVNIQKGYSYDCALYVGQRLDDWTVFCSLSTLFVYDDRVYQWYCPSREEFESYDLFRIVSYPETVPESDFEITVEYRIRPTDEWTRETITYAPEPSRVFIVSSEKDANGNPVFLSQPTLSGGSTLFLLHYAEEYLADAGYLTYDLWGNGILSKMVLGWTENGKPVDYFYSLTPGRHIISSGSVADVPEGYEMTCNGYWFDDSLNVDFLSGANRGYLQTLVGLSDVSSHYATDDAGETTLQVAEGVQAIDLRDCYAAPNNLAIPDSTLYVNTTSSTLWVQSSYSVDSDNPVYAATENGILTNKNGTEYLGIPTSFTEVDVPANVTKVNVPNGLEGSSIKRVVLHAASGDDLPEINLSSLSDCNIVVEDDAFDDFVMGDFASLSATNRLTVSKASDPNVEYVCESGLVVSSGILGRYTNSETDIALIGGPYTLKENCFADAKAVRDVVLTSGGNYTFESGCFNGAIATVVCSTEAQRSYIEEHRTDLGLNLPAHVVLAETSTDGYRYYTAEDIFTETSTSTVFEAPESAVVFDGTVQNASGPIEIDAIAPSAFANHANLRWAMLNESVTSIGEKAFANCTNIEEVFIGQKDSINVASDAFSGCTGMQFLVSCAMTATSFSAPNGSCAMYAPTNSEGYLGKGDYWNGFVSFTKDSGVADYALIEQNGAYLIYGCGAKGSPWLAIASSSNLDGLVELPATTVEIFDNAFSSARGTFTVNWGRLTSLQFIDSGAFANSGVSGEIYLNDVSGGGIVAENAFANCSGVTSFRSDMEVLRLDGQSFAQCKNLKSVKLAQASASSNTSRVFAGAFSKCDALQSIEFTSADPCPLGLFSSGTPFLFNAETYLANPSEEAKKIQLIVPQGSQESYIAKWVYPFAGALDESEYRAVVRKSLRASLKREPTGPEIVESMEKGLLDAENRLRTMMKLENVEHSSFITIENTEGYVFQNIDGATTLMSVPADAETIDLNKVIPESVDSVSLGSGAFSQCTKLQKIVLSSKVSGIQINAFAGCDGVTVEFPDYNWPPALLGWSDVEPFTFGANVKLQASRTTATSCIDFWIYNMVGYASYSDYYDAIKAKLDNGWFPISQSDVIEAMAPHLLSAENALRGLFGLDAVDVGSYVSSVESGGCVFQTVSGNTTLVSVSNEGATVDLNEVTPDFVSNIAIAPYAFSGTSGLDKVILSNKVSTIERNAFATFGGDVITVVLPEVEGDVPTISLDGGTLANPFTFGDISGSMKLVIPENSKKAYLSNWPKQCLGIRDNWDLLNYAWSKLADLPTEEGGPYAEDLNAAVNAPLLEQENYIRSLIDGCALAKDINDRKNFLSFFDAGAAFGLESRPTDEPKKDETGEGEGEQGGTSNSSGTQEGGDETLPTEPSGDGDATQPTDPEGNGSTDVPSSGEGADGGTGGSDANTDQETPSEPDVSNSDDSAPETGDA